MMVSTSQKLVNFLLSFATGILVASLAPVACLGGPGPQGPALAESSRWVVSLKATESCSGCPNGIAFLFEVKDKISGKISRFRLANETSRVTEVRVVNATTGVILGTLADSNVVSVVALPSGRTLDKFLCAGPTVSPDSHFLAFVKWRPAHLPPDVEASDEYLVYDLTRNADYNRVSVKPGVRYDAGRVVYPPGATNEERENIVHGSAIAGAHAMVSWFYWLDKKDLLAFVDRSEGINRLILAGLTEGVQPMKVNVLPLDTSKIIDLSLCKSKIAPSDFKKWSENPGSLIFVTNIEVSRDDPRMLRLSFSPQRCLVVTTLDVPLRNVSNHTAPPAAPTSSK